MSRFSAGGRATIAGTNLLPLASLYSVAGCRPKLVEIGLFNTTATACAVAAVRLSTTGTTGTAITVVQEDDDTQTALATPKNGHTVGPTITAGVLRQASLGAQIGAGVIFTWPDNHPVIVPAATTAGVGIIIPTGTGQVLDFYFTWIE